MLPGWPTRIDVDIEDFLASSGWRVVRRFGDRKDSRSPVLGVEADGERHIIKYAADTEAIGWLRSALRFHAAVTHETIPTVTHHIKAPGALALVEEWGRGEILADAYDKSVVPAGEAGSTYQRFLRLPPNELARAVQQLIEAHVAVVDAGFVAVDLYDGCVLYDFERRRVALIDLDHYQPGPYVLEADRQLGSSSYMPPEEFTRGATIDERATVYTLGRMALVYLACARKAPADRAAFRGSDAQFDVAMAACRPDPGDRIPTVRALLEAWSATL